MNNFPSISSIRRGFFFWGGGGGFRSLPSWTIPSLEDEVEHKIILHCRKALRPVLLIVFMHPFYQSRVKHIIIDLFCLELPFNISLIFLKILQHLDFRWGHLYNTVNRYCVSSLVKTICSLVLRKEFLGRRTKIPDVDFNFLSNWKEYDDAAWLFYFFMHFIFFISDRGS